MGSSDILVSKRTRWNVCRTKIGEIYFNNRNGLSRQPKFTQFSLFLLAATSGSPVTLAVFG